MSDEEAETTTKYTIKSVNTGLLGKHIQETVRVRGEEYKAGDEVDLNELQFKSLKDAGVKFESGGDEETTEENTPSDEAADGAPEIHF